MLGSTVSKSNRTSLELKRVLFVHLTHLTDLVSKSNRTSLELKQFFQHLSVADVGKV